MEHMQDSTMTTTKIGHISDNGDTTMNNMPKTSCISTEKENYAKQLKVSMVTANMLLGVM